MGMGKQSIAALAAIASMVGLATAASSQETRPSFSVNGAFTTDYVFRGLSQSTQDPAMQGGADVSYGMFYAGVWASMIDFGPTAATTEVDLYAGIKKSYSGFDFDVGAIYYIYPGASDAPSAELDYVELKFGVATTVQKFGIGATVFYSPEYTGETGETVTIEGKASYELPSFQGITPSLSGLVGSTISTESNNANFQTAFGKDSYVYWNAGMSFGIDKLTLDFRYWDTNLASGLCSGPAFHCDERFVFTAGVAF